MNYDSHRNYLKFPVNYLPNNEKGIEIYNKIINFLQQHKLKEKDNIFTKSGGVVTYLNGYGVKRTRTGYELVLKLMNTCCRVILDEFSTQKEKGEQYGGKKSFMCISDELQKDGVNLRSYKIDNGFEVKKTIPKAMISKTDALKVDETYHHVHHIDLNSAYAAGISEAHPEMKRTYERLYKKRLESDESKRFIKSVFTNSTGFFQSAYINACYANLAKDAITWTRKRILELSNILIKKGYTPLLYNTDGIWYTKFEKGKEIESEPYVDENCGLDLGQYKNDHINCQFRCKSVGAYEFIEKGTYKSVVRGVNKEIQAKWTWGGIYSEEANILKLISENSDGTLKENNYYVKEKRN